MNYRRLGKWGLKISEISVGSWMTNVAGDAQQEIARKTIELAYDQGVNFFDCANAYSIGGAEIFLGNVLNQFPRHTYVVSSKVYFPMGSRPNERGLSRKHIMDQIDKSLKSLQVDYVDLYFCHRYDTETPMEEALQAMSDIVTQGKALYYGVSEWSPVQLTKGLGMVKDMGLRPISMIQPQYHMMDRYIEDEIIGICKDNGLGITAFSPLAQGLLTGKYKKGQAYPEGSRATHQADKQINNLLTDDNLDKVEKLCKIADGLGISMSVLALAWAIRKPEISCTIVGASNARQLENNLAASDVKLPDEVVNAIEDILGYVPFYRKVG